MLKTKSVRLFVAVLLLIVAWFPVGIHAKRKLSDQVDTAIADGNFALAKQLIRQGADKNEALHEALWCPVGDSAFRPNRQFVRYLLSIGADPNNVAPGGFSAMSDLAWIIIFDPVIGDMFLSHGGRIDPHALYNATWRPEQKTHLTALKWMIQHGVDVNVKVGKNGETALFGAAMGDNVEAIDLLLRHGARVDAVNDYKQTPLMQSAMNLDEASLRPRAAHALLEHGANPNKRGPDGLTALMYLGYAHDVVEGNRVEKGYGTSVPESDAVAIAKDLVAHGARVGTKDLKGQTAEEIARKNGLLKLASYLASAGK